MKTAETDGTIIEFLLGSHPYDGVWFGDQHPEKEGWFWWRKALRDYASHPSPMSADDWQIIALEEDGTQHQVKHENGSAFTGNYQQCLSFYELVSGKSPMSAEPTVQQLRDVSKNNPDTFIAGALYVIDNYKLNSPPMSAEQVEVLHAIMVLAEHGIPGYAFGDNEAACEMDNRLSEICRLASTAPSVKAEGWVSVEDELPKVGQKVDLWLVPDDEEKSYRMTWTWEKESTARITINGCKVTHWQPFTPPKQQL